MERSTVIILVALAVVWCDPVIADCGGMDTAPGTG